MPNKHPEIFISYSWNDDGLKSADELERFFQDKGIAVMRDNRAIGYKGLITEFCRHVLQKANSNLVIPNGSQQAF